jgi:hypothetical protein
MNSKNSLTGSQLRTYDRIFQHPISHNLEWRDVHALLDKLGETVHEHNGNLKVTRNGQVIVLHAPRHKDVAEMDELVSLRHFLERSEQTQGVEIAKEVHWLLVIDHHEARIFHVEVIGAVAERILPYRSEDYFRHAQDSKEKSRGQEKPNSNTFFEPVAKALQAPGPILIFGTGTGTSSEAEQFRNWLKVHHVNLAERIIGLVAVDENHLSDGQLLEKAREFYEPAPIIESPTAKAHPASL